MNRSKYYITLAIYPIAFFAVLGTIQYLILWGAYRQQALRQHPVQQAKVRETLTTPKTGRMDSQSGDRRPNHIVLP